MKIHQIVPLGRPYMARHTYRQFRANRYADKALVLVTGGPGWDRIPDHEAYLKEQGVEWDLLIQEKPGKARALNSAISELADRDAVCLVRDDDDWYGADSMSEFAEGLTHSEIVTQRRKWVYMEGSLYLFRGDEHCNSPLLDANMWGGNVAFRARGAELFDESPSQLLHQCVTWTRNMMNLGAKAWHKSFRDACLIRGNAEHLWRATPLMVRHLTGNAVRFDGFDPDLISGRRPAIGGEIMPQPTANVAHVDNHENLQYWSNPGFADQFFERHWGGNLPSLS